MGEHFKETARLLGYNERDLIFRCGPSVSWLVGHTSHAMADVGIACTTIKTKRMAQVDFSAPYFHTGYKILVNAKRNQESGKSAGDYWQDVALFLAPFTGYGWGVIIVLVIVVAMLLLLVEYDQDLLDTCVAGSTNKKDDAEEKQQPTFAKAIEKAQIVMFALMSTLTMILAGRDAAIEVLASPLGQALGNLAFMTGVLIMALYTANLAAFMTVRNVRGRIENMDDLAQRTEPVGLICVTGKPKRNYDAITEYLYAEYRSVFNRAVCYANAQKMAEAVLSNEVLAGFWDASVLDAIVKTSNCELETVGDLFALQEYGYMFPKNSVLRDPFSEAITKTRMSAWTMDLEKKYLKPSCEQSIDAQIESMKIDHGPFVGLLYLWLCICLLALLVRASSKRLERKNSRFGKSFRNSFRLKSEADIDVEDEDPLSCSVGAQLEKTGLGEVNGCITSDISDAAHERHEQHEAVRGEKNQQHGAEVNL